MLGDDHRGGRHQRNVHWYQQSCRSECRRVLPVPQRCNPNLLFLPHVLTFFCSYGCCIDANTYVYCSEIFPTHIRSRGLAFSLAVLFLSTIAYLEAAPTAFAQIGWKYYLLFIVLTAINIPLIWYFCPETKRLSLEEIGEKFGDEVAVHLTDLTEEERLQLDKVIECEKEGLEPVHAENQTAKLQA